MSPPLDAITRSGVFGPDPADRNAQRARELRKQASRGGLTRDEDGADISVEALENADAVRSVNDNTSEDAHEDREEQGGAPAGRRGKRAKPDKPRIDLKG